MPTRHAENSLAEYLSSLDESELETWVQTVTEGLSDEEVRAFLDGKQAPEIWLRPKQRPPPGDWGLWLLLAGRGFGKTFTGSHWVHQRAHEKPNRWMALVAKTPADARDVMVEGTGGLLQNPPPWCVLAPGGPWPRYESSKRRVTWPNGAWATIFSDERPDQLRGFSGDTAWLDEFAKFLHPREVWDNLQFGLRELSDDMPRQLITTTPRPIPLLRELQTKPNTTTVIGSSYENRANLSPTWFSTILSAYEGTQLGRQEIHAEILQEVEGRIYSNFSSKVYPEGSIDPTVADTGGDILIGQDFNVNPMASVIAVAVGDECHVLDAMQLITSNTDEVCQEIQQRYPGRRVIFYPDPAGNQRRSSTSVVGQTDFTVIRSYGFEIDAPNRAPAIVDRTNNTQAMLLQNSRRRVRIHPRATHLIDGLSYLQYKEGTKLRDKQSGWDHICDAFDYLLWTRFPVIESGAVQTDKFVIA